MKVLIFYLLFLYLLAITLFNDSIIEVNLMPEEKIQVVEKTKIIEQTKMELKTEEHLESKNIENKKRLLSLSWAEVDSKEKVTWIILKIKNWQYFENF